MLELTICATPKGAAQAGVGGAGVGCTVCAMCGLQSVRAHGCTAILAACRTPAGSLSLVCIVGVGGVWGVLGPSSRHANQKDSGVCGVSPACAATPAPREPAQICGTM